MSTLLTLDEVAERLRLPADTNRARTVRRLIRDKGVSYKKVGRDVMLTPSQYDRLFEALTCSPSDKEERTGTPAASFGKGRKRSASVNTARERLKKQLREPTQTA